MGGNMRLRNKKTGEIKEWECVAAINYGEMNEVYDSAEYESLAKLNDEWEDYEPKEPLIKDERIRRAVRAWVEIGKYERVYYDRAYNRLADDYDFVHCIEFAIDPCPEAESERCYTLTELCGEEG